MSTDLTHFLEKLEHADIQDQEMFLSILEDAVSLFNLNDGEAAAIVDVSRPTFNRWRNRMTSPRPVVRKSVYRSLMAYAQSKSKTAKRVERRLGGSPSPTQAAMFMLGRSGT